MWDEKPGRGALVSIQGIDDESLAIQGIIDDTILYQNTHSRKRGPLRFTKKVRWSSLKEPLLSPWHEVGVLYFWLPHPTGTPSVIASMHCSSRSVFRALECIRKCCFDDTDHDAVALTAQCFLTLTKCFEAGFAAALLDRVLDNSLPSNS